MTEQQLTLKVEGAGLVAWQPEARVWEPVDPAPEPGTLEFATMQVVLMWLDFAVGPNWETGPWDPWPDRRRADEAVAHLKRRRLEVTVVHVPPADPGEPGRVY